MAMMRKTHDEVEFYSRLEQQCKSLRDIKGISVDEVIKVTGMSRSLLYEFEMSGKKVSAFRLNKLMKLLGLPNIEDVVYNGEKKDSQPMGAVALVA